MAVTLKQNKIKIKLETKLTENLSQKSTEELIQIYKDIKKERLVQVYYAKYKMNQDLQRVKWLIDARYKYLINMAEQTKKEREEYEGLEWDGQNLNLH